LACRVTEELTSRYREQVTVIMPSRRKNSGPRIMDPDPAAQGVALARRLGLPLVIGQHRRPGLRGGHAGWPEPVSLWQHANHQPLKLAIDNSYNFITGN